MHSGKTVPSQKVDIVSQFLRIPAALGKGNDTPVLQALAVNCLSQFFPHRILPPALGRHGPQHLDPHLLVHGRSADQSRLRGQICRGQVKGFNGRRQSDALERPFAEPVQPCNGKHQMGAPFCIDQGMKLIHDHCLCRPQHGLPCFGGEHQIQGFRRDDKDMGRMPDHSLPVLLGRVPGADRHPETIRHLPLSHQLRLLADPIQGAAQVFPDIPSQGF